MGVLVVIVAGVFGIFLIMKKPPEPAAAPDRPDPFADLPPDLPAGHATAAPAASENDGTTRADPFADVSSPREDPLWLNALGKANRALALIEKAVAAREAGDAAEARARGKEAQTLLEEATEETKDWALDLEKRYGPEDKFVKLVQKRTTRWRRELMALHKSAGL